MRVVVAVALAAGVVWLFGGNVAENRHQASPVLWIIGIFCFCYAFCVLMSCD